MTGASGNIGSAVVRELAADGHEVLAVARRRPAVPRTSAHATVEWRCADVARDDLDTLVSEVEAVVHLAWKIQPTHRPQETWETNAVGTRRLLAALGRNGAPPLVVASSVAAYSPVDHDDPVDESWLTDGASPAAYCREKAYVERALDGMKQPIRRHASPVSGPLSCSSGQRAASNADCSADRWPGPGCSSGGASRYSRCPAGCGSRPCTRRTWHARCVRR